MQVHAQEMSLIEKLGYSKTDKLLIVHADDIGLAHSENEATIKAIREGIVNSTSIMMPCAWSSEVGDRLSEMPNVDIGVHITLTNEWKNYKWGPVSSKNQVRGLVGLDGFMYKDCASVAANASPEEVEKEIKAQIEAAKRIGILPTHLDSHMGCVFYGKPEFFAKYLEIAQEYQIPPMVSQQMIDQIVKPNLGLFRKVDFDMIPIVDNILGASTEEYDEIGMDKIYTGMLENLQPGISVLILHVAFDDAEMQAVTKDFTHWHAKWRQDDYDFLTSEKAKNLIKDNNIKLITWREIGNAIRP